MSSLSLRILALALPAALAGPIQTHAQSAPPGSVEAGLNATIALMGSAVILSDDDDEDEPSGGTQSAATADPRVLAALNSLSETKADTLEQLVDLAEQNGISDLTALHIAALLDIDAQEPANTQSQPSDNGWWSAIIDLVRQQGEVDAHDVAFGPSQPVTEAMIAAILERILGQGSGGAGPNPPPNYPYFDQRSFTPHPITAVGTYTGSVTGETASHAALAGTANFNVNVGSTVAISGQFDFGSAGIVQISQAAPNMPLGFHHGAPGFLGGTITSTDSTIFDFYGPNAEQYAGWWGFTVAGGSDPGAVTGSFVTSR